MSLLHNIGRPGWTREILDVRKTGTTLMFSPKELRRLLGCKKEEELHEAAREWALAHPEEMERRPRGFLISVSKGPGDELVGDIPLLINVFSRTIGGLYVPGKEPLYAASRFDTPWCFLKEDIEE